MNFLKIAVVILFLLSTVITVKIRPEIHQPMLIEDADFKLTRISDTITTTKTVPNSTPPKSPQKIKTVEQPKTQKTVEVIPQKTEKKEKKVVQNSPSQLELLQRVVKNAEKAQQVEQPKVEKTTKPVQETVSPTTEDVKTTSKAEDLLNELVKELSKNPQQVIEIQPTNSTHQNPYMTEQEEIIAWNKWRSNIQNQIMRDSDIEYAPLGTMFSFTFVVDKFGNVSNIKVECSHPSFMDVARNNVKPAIANLQRKPILAFPKGTQRTSTVVTGVFIIGTQERFSTPSDYSDYERITY